jgi:hypothetical protein
VYVNIGDNIEMAKFLGLSKALNLENVSFLKSYFEHLGLLKFQFTKLGFMFAFFLFG